MAHQLAYDWDEALSVAGNETGDVWSVGPTDGNPTVKRRGWRVLGLAGLLAAIAAPAGAGLVGYRDLTNELKAGSRQIESLDLRQETLVQQLNALAEQQRALSGEMGIFRSELTKSKFTQIDSAAIARAVQPSVVEVGAGRRIGSGFVVSSRGGTSTIATSFHIIQEVWATGGRTVSILAGARSLDGTVARVNEEHDVALISVPAALPALPQARTTPVLGDPLLVAGSPRGLEGTVSTGIVSAERILGGRSYIQFTAPTSPGNSGGPVVDRTGAVLGLVSMKDSGPGAEGIAFAIPISRVCTELGGC